MMELLSQGIELPVESVCDVFVANLSADDRPQAFQVVSCLRDKGIKADMDHVGRSLKAQFKYAGKIGARHVVMVGGEEALRGNVKVRDMETREECETPVNDIAAFFTK
jgi:histidyl-tRNA synthetase